jgi:NADH dehydrogenase
MLGAGIAVGVAAGYKALQSAQSNGRVQASEIGHGKTIVILGAGFGGIHVAEELAKLIPSETRTKIIVIDQNNFLLFTPMLTEAAGAQVDARDVVSPVQCLSPRIRFVQGRVDSVDLDAKTVTLTAGATEDGVPEAQQTIQADQIVIALGSVTNYHDLPGVRENSLAIKSLADAAAIRNRALALLERADSEADPEERRALLTVVVGGGGFSGVETMASLNDLLRDGVRDFPNLREEDIKCSLVQPGKRLLPELDENLASYAQRELQKRGVDVRLNTEIDSAGPDFVQLKNGPRIPSHLLVWAAGVKPSPVVEKLDCKRGHHGGIVVDECCAVVGHPGIWAIGDCAEVPQPSGKGTYAPTAQNAMREGTQVAKNIAAVMSGKQPEPFVYKPIGELAIVGKRAGVARIYGRNFRGLPAWAMWRFIYLAKMPGARHRIRIAVDWMLDMIFGREVSVLPIGMMNGHGQPT